MTIVDCAVYEDGCRRAGELPLTEAGEAARCDDAFVWIGVYEPTEEEFDSVRREFDLHELAVEDAINAHQRPKVELYGNTLLMVLKTVRYIDASDDLETGEILLFINRDFVVTVRHGQSRLHDVRLEIEDRPDLLRYGTGAVLYAIVDRIVDDYEPVVEGLDDDIAEVEESVFQPVRHYDPTERIYLLTQEVSDFYRVMHPLLAPLDALERGTSFSQIDPALRRYYRDVNDHLKLAHDEVVGLRDQLARLLSANLALISLRETSLAATQNATMKKLTALATIFLPITFVTGFFGQNFAYLVNHMSTQLAFVLASLAQLGVVVGLLVFFKRRDWL